MKIDIQIDVAATAAQLDRIAQLKGPRRKQLHEDMAMGVEALVRKHLREGPATRRNRFGATSTGFYQRVIDSVSARATSTQGTVSIVERGFALRLHGGTVKPTRKQWLTIPAVAEAHGKRVREVGGGYAKQRWVFGSGGRPTAIAEKSTGRVLFWLTKITTHHADPSLLPTESKMGEAAARIVRMTIG